MTKQKKYTMAIAVSDGFVHVPLSGHLYLMCKALHEHKGSYVSLDNLSKELGTTKATVKVSKAKLQRELSSYGLAILTSRNAGYRLVEVGAE